MCETGQEYVTDKKMDINKMCEALKIVEKVVDDDRRKFLKNYSTKELIQELKRRGINMPKKYR